MPNGSVELTNARREEIISLCEWLYQTVSFIEITLRNTAGARSLTRPSIYNCFQTKEEILLALMQKGTSNGRRGWTSWQMLLPP